MIWCVEDDSDIREIEVYTLTVAGFEAKGFEEGKSMLKEIEKEIPQLIILDVMLPDMDGVRLLKKLKENPKTNKIPIIMATAKGSEYDKIQSLDLGADDYLVKPFGMMEMVSRVKAVLRRVENSTHVEEVLTIRTLKLDKRERSLSIEGQKIELTYKEYMLLELFLSNVGRAFTREEIFLKVWGEAYMGETRTLDAHIRSLRAKLSDYGNRIQTVRNVGYRWEVSD